MNVVVSTCADYDDCWIAFDSAFAATVCADNRINVTLVTDSNPKNIILQNVDIFCTGSKLWSQSLSMYLESKTDKYFLYLQEDYFLQRLDFSEILDFVCRNDFKQLYLNPNYLEYKKVGRATDVFLSRPSCSLQACVWDRIEFLSLIEKFRNPWIFEIYGRLYKYIHKERPHVFTSPVIEYIFTGVNRGRWNVDAVLMLTQMGFHSSYFEARGIYTKNYIVDKLNLLMKVLNLSDADTWHAIRSIFK